MKKLPFPFLVLLMLSLCSFAIYENYEDNSPVEESLRKDYLSLYRTQKLPYRIDKNSNFWRSLPLITATFSHFIPFETSRFGRGSMDRGERDIYRFYPDAIIFSNHKFDAVIYIQDDLYFMPRSEEDNFPDFVLQTIDKKGDVISTKKIYRYDLQYRNEVSAIIKKNLSIEINMSQYNEETNRYYMETEYWKIDNNGKIKMIKPQKNVNSKPMKKG